jgi:hypothetical protein
MTSLKINSQMFNIQKVWSDAICLVVEDTINKRPSVKIPLTGLTPPHFSACSKPGTGSPFVAIFFMFNDLR